MNYLLDTDAIIFMICGLKAPPRQRARRARAEKAAQRCRQVQREGHSIGVSAVTVSELEFGARNSGDYETEINAVANLLTPFDVFDYDAVNAPMHYGKIRRELETAGRVIGAMDLLIAAHALSLDATLVTNNVSHFSRVSGLQTANWSR